MSERWILVDGYSVLHGWPALRKLAGRSLQHEREALVRVLRQYADQSRARMTVVFDGYGAKHKPAVVEPTPGVEVIFSDRGKTADDVIERLVGQAEQRSRILVVTSDSRERQTVENLGATSVSAEVFQGEVDAVLKELARAVRFHGRPRRLGTIHERLV